MGHRVGSVFFLLALPREIHTPQGKEQQKHPASIDTHHTSRCATYLVDPFVFVSVVMEVWGGVCGVLYSLVHLWVSVADANLHATLWRRLQLSAEKGLGSWSFAFFSTDLFNFFAKNAFFPGAIYDGEFVMEGGTTTLPRGIRRRRLR